MSLIEELKQPISEAWYFNVGRNLSPSINETGEQVAYVRTRANWKENRYDNDLFLFTISSGESVQLTRGNPVSQFKWMGNSILFTSNDDKGKMQLWLFKNLRGEAIQLTQEEDGIQGFSSNSSSVVIRVVDKEKFHIKKRDDSYGSVVFVEEEKPSSKLLHFDISEMEEYVDRKLISEEKDLKPPYLNLLEDFEEPLAISGIDLSENYLIFTGSPKSDLIFAKETRNFIISLEDKSIKKLQLPDHSRILSLSPTEEFALVSYQERDDHFYTQSDLWTIGLKELLEGTGELKKMTGEIDQSILSSYWTNGGIVVSYFEGTRVVSRLIDLDGKLQDIKIIDGWSAWIDRGNLAGDFAASVFSSNKPPALMYSSKGAQGIIAMSQLEVTSVETITWKSKDGTEIQGVIRYPPGYDDSKKYPLAFIVHGGPSWVSMESAVTSGHLRYYPALQLSKQGVIIVEPNYRGSIGRGQKFLELNVNNLGIGDLWDIESCIDFLGDRVDANKVYCMGWSQGGYISAMATTHSDKFAAVSVGAGISDWYSYWMTTDIRNFTEDYLSSDPLKDREIYRKTSPMSAIDRAKTPTLIQIGQNDNRVPLVNATELYRTLKLKGVETYLFMYPGMPHGINKPKENLAIITQNYQWFSHHIFGTELNFLPVDESEEES